MTAERVPVQGGTVTSPRGFVAGGTYAGIKTYGAEKLDLGILFSEVPATCAGVFTTNRVVSPSVLLSRQRVRSGRARAVVVNSGCANACVGLQGLKDAEEATELAARKLGIPPEETLICSTGIIGVELPMALIRQAIPKVVLSQEGGHDFARAILTTDTRTKEAAFRLSLPEGTVTLGGCAKGAAMIHPQMATMLAFLTTDARVDPEPLRSALRAAVDDTFNMITVDGDTSTNDTVLLFANGASGVALAPGSPGWEAFREGLQALCHHLALEIVRDAEGGTKVIEVRVEGARTREEARAVARTVASSVLTKTAVHGNDPNWGRVMASVGRAGVEVDEGRIALYINDICLVENGTPIPYFKEAVIASMNRPLVTIRVHLHLGDASATAWGSDLSEEYVTLNSAYTT